MMNLESYFYFYGLDVVDLKDDVLDAVVAMMMIRRIMRPSGKMSDGRVGNFVAEKRLLVVR